MIMVQTSLGINERPYVKITNTKKAGSVTCVVQHSPSKYEAVSTNKGEGQGENERNRNEEV
jgi:hypothetical protein